MYIIELLSHVVKELSEGSRGGRLVGVEVEFVEGGGQVFADVVVLG